MEKKMIIPLGFMKYYNKGVDSIEHNRRYVIHLHIYTWPDPHINFEEIRARYIVFFKRDKMNHNVLMDKFIKGFKPEQLIVDSTYEGRNIFPPDINIIKYSKSSKVCYSEIVKRCIDRNEEYHEKLGRAGLENLVDNQTTTKMGFA